MKKTFTKLGFFALAMLLGAGSLSAQVIYSENFNTAVKPNLPANMTDVNNDGSTAHPDLANVNFGTRGWATFGTTNKFAISYSYKTPQADDWMITPAITLSGNYGLYWKAFTPAAPNNDGYEVRISTTDKNLSSFTDVVYSSTGEGFNGGNFLNHYVDLSAYNGQTVYIAFRNNTPNRMYLEIDDLVVDNALPSDAAVTGISAGGIYKLVPSNNNVGGTITNTGGATITSVEIYWSVNGGTPTIQTLSGLNIEPLQSYNFTLTSKLDRSAVGAYPVELWIDNLNGTDADAIEANNTLLTTFYGVSTVPTKSVVIEEATGTWCGYCPRGSVYMDSIAKIHPNSTVLIAVHNQDPMKNTIYDAGMGTVIDGYPSVLVNRNIVDDPSAVFTLYNQTITDFGLADLSLTAVYNPLTKKVTGNASAIFAAPASGDFRLAMVVTEDSVTGTGNSYAQVNYYANNALGKMGGYESKPNPVPANQMRYDYVAREIVGGFTGQTGSLPATIADGSQHTYTFTSSALNTVIRPSKLYAHILLLDAANKVIMNGKTTKVTTSTGIGSIENPVTDVVTFPNPATDFITVGFSLDKAEPVNVSVVNAVGQTVHTQPAVNLAPGQHEIRINTADLAKGTYFVQIGTSAGAVSQHFVKAE